MEESLGQYLQRVRIEKGHSLNKISEVTRIGLQYLKALEADDFSKLPAYTFAKAYAKTYARYIGLDVTDVLTRFGQAAGPFYRQQETEQLVIPAKTGNVITTRLNRIVANLKMLF
jgi:cytoskeleton protein RodZ